MPGNDRIVRSTSVIFPAASPLSESPQASARGVRTPSLASSSSSMDMWEPGTPSQASEDSETGESDSGSRSSRSQRSPEIVASTYERFVGNCIYQAINLASGWSLISPCLPGGRGAEAARMGANSNAPATRMQAGATSLAHYWLPSLAAHLPRLNLPIGEAGIKLPEGRLVYSSEKEGLEKTHMNHLDVLRTYQPQAESPLTAPLPENTVLGIARSWLSSAWGTFGRLLRRPAAATQTPPEAAAQAASSTFPEIMEKVLLDTHLRATTSVKAGVTVIPDHLPFDVRVTVPAGTHLDAVADITGGENPKLSSWKFTFSNSVFARIEPSKNVLGRVFGWLSRCFQLGVDSVSVGTDGISTLHGVFYIFGFPLRFATTLKSKWIQFNTDVRKILAGEFLKGIDTSSDDPQATHNTFKMLQEHLGTIEVGVTKLRPSSHVPSYTWEVPQDLQAQLGQSVRVSRKSVKLAIDFDAPVYRKDEEDETTTVYGSVLHVRAQQTSRVLWKSPEGVKEYRPTTVDLTTSTTFDDPEQTTVAGNLHVHMRSKDPHAEPLLFDVSTNYTSEDNLLQLKAHRFNQPQKRNFQLETQPLSEDISPTAVVDKGGTFASASVRLEKVPVLEMLHVRVAHPVTAYGLQMEQVEAAFIHAQPEEKK